MEFKIKNTMKYHYPPIGMSKIKESVHGEYWWDVVKLDCVIHASENVKW